MRGQLSVEMLVILVVVLGLAVLAASALLKSGNKAAEKIEQKTGAVLNATDYSAGGNQGDYCASDEDCRSSQCDSYSKKCF